MHLKKIFPCIFFALLALVEALPSRAQVGSDYKIAPSDVLVIEVIGERDLTKEFRVSRTGEISFPYLDSVTVVGKTVVEIKELITELLDKDYIVNPQVVVDVKEYHPREVLINGQVNKPGSVALPGEQKLSILDAIGRAGGLTNRADPKKIKFSRRGRKEITYSLDDLKRESDPDKIIALEPGDVIEVGDKIF